ncbi:MAG: hypothetical protein NT016_03760 [Candidatus Aenigmarchaeota archaeon]|nr:hypothetical protein [Candidatus Aenigmarchaeota archaeon]
MGSESKNRFLMLAAVAVVAMLPVAAFATRAYAAQAQAHGSTNMQDADDANETDEGTGHAATHEADGSGWNRTVDWTGPWSATSTVSGTVVSVGQNGVNLLLDKPANTGSAGSTATSAPTNSDSDEGESHGHRGMAMRFMHFMQNRAVHLSVPSSYTSGIGLGKGDRVSVTYGYMFGSSAQGFVPLAITLDGTTYGSATANAPIWLQ